MARDRVVDGWLLVGVLGWLAAAGGARAAEEEAPPAEAGRAADEEQPELDGLLQGVQDYSQLDLGQLLGLPVVESASLRRQSILDSPVSISVLTREEIESSGATNVAQLLRRLPGVLVLQESANAYLVGVRGLSALGNNRTLLLVDGSPAMDRMTGLQLWPALAVLPGDLERIEVIRGPGATLYGSDALSGVINLVTKRPVDHPGFEATAWGLLDLMADRPDGSADDVWMANGGGAHLAYAWADEGRTLGVRLAGGLALDPEWSPTIATQENGPLAYDLRATFEYRPDKNLEVLASFSHAAAETNRVQNWIPVRNPMQVQTLSLHLEKRELGVDWLTLRLDVDGHRQAIEYIALPHPEDSLFQLLPLDMFRMPCVTWDAHVRAQLDLTFWDRREVLSVGGEVTYFGVEEFYTQPWMVFGGVLVNNDLTLLDDRSLILSLGGRYEAVTSREADFGEILYQHLSPKAALIWKPTSEHSLRLAGGSSYRTPQPMETFIDWSVHATDPNDPPSHVLIGNPRLLPERLYGGELGYQGLLYEGLRLDAVLFGQAVQDLVGMVRETRVPLFMENVQDLYQVGLELALSYSLAQVLRAYLNYTFVYSLDAESLDAVKDWPTHLWSFGLEAALPAEVRLGLDVGLVFDYRPLVASASSPTTGVGRLDWSARQAADAAHIDLRLSKRLFDDHVEVFLMVRNLVGFFREPAGLKSIPEDYALPIGGTVLAGLRLGGW
ncbi:MAG TPA: TonB-dependent receptor [Myxococcota bacterium]|nr:TonB-dependent receptor [Myxococcota bacterium]HRY96578.1 TonB-dependent receptor [Myxococcota bacterium]